MQHVHVNYSLKLKDGTEIVRSYVIQRNLKDVHKLSTRHFPHDSSGINWDASNANIDWNSRFRQLNHVFPAKEATNPISYLRYND